MNLNEINIRDPFIVADERTNTYYMYASSPECLTKGFCVYTSDNLTDWIGPISVFESNDDFWGTQDFWAPEVHYYKGMYYLFGSFSGNGKTRNSQILVSDSLMGPFKVHSKPIAPDGWFALDATLYINDGTPYAIFSHEWVQVKDGEMCCIQLSDDLKTPVGEPEILFSASRSGWSVSPDWNISASSIYVVDAPFVYNIDGKEFMLWSSWSDKKNDSYSVGVVYPVEGKSILDGEYRHELLNLPDADCGHAMIFKDFEGNYRICYHDHNSEGGKERAKIHHINLKDGKVTVTDRKIEISAVY